MKPGAYRYRYRFVFAPMLGPRRDGVVIAPDGRSWVRVGQRFADELAALVSEFWQEAADAITESFGQRTDADSPLLRELEGFALRWGLHEGAASRLLADGFEAVERQATEDLERQALNVLGVNPIAGNEPLREVIEETTARSLENINDITPTVLAQMGEIINRGWEAGWSQERMGRELSERAGVAGSRAKFIARNESGNLYSATTEHRQRESGVNRYIWRTSEDERVVGTPGGRYPNPTPGHGDHHARNGHEFSWDEPPGDGHPGRAYNCRCTASPVFDEPEGDGPPEDMLGEPPDTIDGLPIIDEDRAPKLVELGTEFDADIDDRIDALMGGVDRTKVKMHDFNDRITSGEFERINESMANRMQDSLLYLDDKDYKFDEVAPLRESLPDVAYRKMKERHDKDPDLFRSVLFQETDIDGEPHNGCAHSFFFDDEKRTLAVRYHEVVDGKESLVVRRPYLSTGQLIDLSGESTSFRLSDWRKYVDRFKKKKLQQPRDVFFERLHERVVEQRPRNSEDLPTLVNEMGRKRAFGAKEVTQDVITDSTQRALETFNVAALGPKLDHNAYLNNYINYKDDGTIDMRKVFLNDVVILDRDDDRASHSPHHKIDLEDARARGLLSDKVNYQYAKDEVRTTALDVGKSSSVDDCAETQMHEVGHMVERRNRRVHDASVHLLARRVNEAKASGQTIKDIYRNGREFGWDDDFYSPYVGKIYDWSHANEPSMKAPGANPNDFINELRSTEILSMGIEKFHNAKMMRWLYEKDPEHFSHVMSTVLGEYGFAPQHSFQLLGHNN